MSFLALFLSAALGAAAAAETQPKIGPELELRGPGHYPALACALTLYPKGRKSLENLSAITFIAGMPLWTTSLVLKAQADRELEEEGTVSAGARNASYAAFGLATAGFAVSMACPAVRARSNRAYDEKLEKALRALCADGHCQVTSKEIRHWWDKNYFNDLTVTYPDNFKIHFTHDSAVTEVKTSPIPLGELAGRQGLLQREVYDLLGGLGLKAPRFDGPWNGGHLHWDIAHSFAEPRHLRNFLVDLYNQRELTQGLLVDDPVEAGHPFDIDGGKRFRQGIAEMDRLLLKEEAAPKDPAARAALMRDFIEKMKVSGIEEYLSKETGIHFNARLGTLEMRALRSPKEAALFEKVARLLGGRIKWVQRQPGLLPLRELNSKRPSREARLASFAAFVAEAGENPAEMAELVPDAKTMRINDAISGCMHFFRGFAKGKD